MPRTLFDKIWDFHLVGQRSDGRDLIYIDRHVLHELHAHHAFTHLEKEHRAVHRPDLTFAVQDHTVATKPGRNDETNPSGTAFLKSMREGTRRNGIRLFDIDDPEQGISHVVAPEVGMVLPGATHAVPDSHASTVGGVGALAFGCGTTEMTHILVTQVMALKRPQAYAGAARRPAAAHVSAKDVALRLIAELGVAGARGYVVEYAGTAIARHADRAAHDAVQPQHRDGRPLGFRCAGRQNLRLAAGSSLCAEGRDVGSRTRLLGARW